MNSGGDEEEEEDLCSEFQLCDLTEGRNDQTLKLGIT